jgi:hypothetical protein
MNDVQCSTRLLFLQSTTVSHPLATHVGDSSWSYFASTVMVGHCALAVPARLSVMATSIAARVNLCFILLKLFLVRIADIFP